MNDDRGTHPRPTHPPSPPRPTREALKTDLTLTSTEKHDGALRHWSLRGPLGLIRLEMVDATTVRSAFLYVHDATPPAGCELEPCELCPNGCCWIDAISNSVAWDLREAWEAAGRDDEVILAELTRLYEINLLPLDDPRVAA